MAITNRVTEKDLRDYLTGVGYYGRSAKIHELELAAIERPGWLQVFRFHLEAKHQESGWSEFWGVIRDDERDKIEIRMYGNTEERDKQLSSWSHGLLSAGRENASPIGAVLAIGVLLLLIVIGVAQLLSSAS